MLDTIELAIKAATDVAMIIAIAAVAIAFIRERRKDRLAQARLTAADRGAVRSCIIAMLSGAALAWAAVLATVVHEPGLVREPLLPHIVFMPLLVTFMAAIWSRPAVLANLQPRPHFRARLIALTSVVAFGVAAALLVLLNVWMGRA